MNRKTDEGLRAILPSDRITQDPGDIRESLTVNPLGEPEVTPGCIVRPQDKRELGQLIELSNEKGLNLTITSSAGRHTKGGCTADRESIRIDLAPWKAIEHVDRRNRVCLIQPGVTYGELSAALREHGMVVPMPLAPRDGKSVVASVTDREPSTWPSKQWDWGDPVGSTEVIFGNGSPIRTGSAGGPGSLAAQRAAGGAQKYSGGPSQTDLHRVVQGSQGTIGVVTWITVRAETAPTVQKPFLVGADTLDALVPFVYGVERPGLGEHAFILNHQALGMLMARPDAAATDDGRGLLPAYICLVNVAGFERLPAQRLRYQERDIREIADRHGLSLVRELGEVSADNLLDVSTRPCGQVDWRHGARGHCLSLFFLTTLDRTPEFTRLFSDTAARHGLQRRDIGVYLQPVVQNHACHVEFMIPFDPAAAVRREPDARV